MTDLVRVIRIIEYVGPREWVEKTVAKSIHGIKTLDNGARITAMTLGEFPESVTEVANTQCYLCGTDVTEGRRHCNHCLDLYAEAKRAEILSPSLLPEDEPPICEECRQCPANVRAKIRYMGRTFEEKKVCFDCYETYRDRFVSFYAPSEANRITSLEVYHL